MEIKYSVNEAEKYYDKIYRYCYYKVKNTQTAEDLTQETFLKFLQSGYREEGKALNFLYTVARNLCMDEFRRKKGEMFLEEKTADTGMQPNVPETAFAEGFENSLVDRITVQDALNKMAEEDRELLMLRYGNGESLEVMCAFYGLSRFALYRRLKKTEKRFQNLMGKRS